MRIGIDLGGTKIEGVLLDGSGQIAARERVPTPRGLYDDTIQAIVGLIARLEAHVGRAAHAAAPAATPAAQGTAVSAAGIGSRVSVGIGMPGAVSPATGLIKNANSTWLNGQPFPQDMERALGRPIRVANDADCLTLSEATDGAAAGAPVVFGVIIGTGTGGGIAVNQRLCGGPNAIAGEWGHNMLPWPRDGEWPGPPCYCGRTACIETFLSGPALERDYQRASGRDASAIEISRCADAGDPLAEAALARYEDRLARGLASIINVLDPTVIVLGGGMSNLARLYERVPRIWGEFVFSDRVDTRLVRAMHGDSSGVRGAAWLWQPGEYV